METFRITIDVLNPRVAGGTRSAEQATLSQAPISEWLEVTDWYDLAKWLREARPIHRLGLIFGHQQRTDDAAWRPGMKLAGFPADAKTFAEIDAWVDARDESIHQMRRAVLARVDEFLAGFDFAAYGLAAGLELAATKLRGA